MVRDLPTGVVTLLSTDVEGSTRLLHELGDVYGEALASIGGGSVGACGQHEGVDNV